MPHLLNSLCARMYEYMKNDSRCRYLCPWVLFSDLSITKLSSVSALDILRSERVDQGGPRKCEHFGHYYLLTFNLHMHPPPSLSGINIDCPLGNSAFRPALLSPVFGGGYGFTPYFKLADALKLGNSYS